MNATQKAVLVIYISKLLYSSVILWEVFFFGGGAARFNKINEKFYYTYYIIFRISFIIFLSYYFVIIWKYYCILSSIRRFVFIINDYV